MLETKNAHAIRMAARAHGRPFVRVFLARPVHFDCAKAGPASFKKSDINYAMAIEKIRAPPPSCARKRPAFFRDFSRTIIINNNETEHWRRTMVFFCFFQFGEKSKLCKIRTVLQWRLIVTAL